MNIKRVLALAAALILFALYGASLILAVMGNPGSRRLLMAAITASIILPALCYAVLVAKRFLSGRRETDKKNR